MEILQVQLIKSKNLIITFLACICVIFLSGCSDNPQNKAAKQVRQKTKEALDIVDSISSLQMLSIEQRREKAIELYAEAREKVQSALSEAQRAGVSVDPALLVSGNLAFEQASQMFSSLTDGAKPMIQMVEGISDLLHEITVLLIEKDKLEALLNALEVEVEQVEANISGGGHTVPLKQQLDDKVSEFEQLQKQLDDLTSQLQQTKAVENEIQRRAEEKLRLSELATGSEKLMLEREAYEILQGRKDTVLRNMSVVDRIENVEGRIMAVEPLVAKIESDLNTALGRLDAIENSARRSQLQQQLSDITDAIPQSQEQIDGLRTLLQQAQQIYSESFDEIMALLQLACQDYKKVRGESASLAAKVQLALCYSQAANMSLGSMRLHDGIGLRLESMGASAEGMDVLSETAGAFAEAGADYGGKAAENYDEAIKIYDSLNKTSGRVGEEFACDVIKNYLLALHGRISLAENLGDSATADSLQTKVGELMEAAEKFGAVFSKSTTARILSGTTNYVPVLAVDNTAYYEEFRNQFQAWPRLKAAEREVEVNRLLALANEKKAELADEEFNKIIDPEIQRLQEAIAKGFEEEEEPVRVVITDPNYM
jgi:hypothetical protein